MDLSNVGVRMKIASLHLPRANSPKSAQEATITVE